MNFRWLKIPLRPQEYAEFKDRWEKDGKPYGTMEMWIRATLLSSLKKWRQGTTELVVIEYGMQKALEKYEKDNKVDTSGLFTKLVKKELQDKGYLKK